MLLLAQIGLTLWLVDELLAEPTPFRSGRAAFPHPAPYVTDCSTTILIDTDKYLGFGQCIMF